MYLFDLFWDNRGWIGAIILALMIGYVWGNPKHLDIIFEENTNEFI